MKYADLFRKLTKSGDAERTLDLLDTHYPLMTKLVSLYNACKKKLPDDQNVFIDDMRRFGITVADVASAAEYFRIEKKEHKKSLDKYFSERPYLGGIYGEVVSTPAI